jgi:hypothetical protein
MRKYYYFLRVSGENSSTYRKLVCTDMDYFGIHWMKLKMKYDQNNYEINTQNSTTKILVGNQLLKKLNSDTSSLLKKVTFILLQALW